MPLLNSDLINGLSHITGGGILENTQRVISDTQKIRLDWAAWPVPAIFNLIQEEGNVPIEDMRRSFNMGIGMILIVNKKNLKKIENHLSLLKEPFSLIGEIV